MAKEALLLSIKPKSLSAILYENKTIDIRTNVLPREKLPIDVYLYCTKEKPIIIENGNMLNGKVVAKFVLNKPYMLMYNPVYNSYIGLNINDGNLVKEEDLLKSAKLSRQALHRYGRLHTSLYAWPINNLEKFKQPKNVEDYTENAAESYCYIKV